MANEIITGNQTATYFADSGDVITLAAGASLITTDEYGLTTRTNQDIGITLQINGRIETIDVLPVSGFIDSAAIFLNSSGGVGAGIGTGNIVRIGTTGHVFSANGMAIFTTGAGTTIHNRGLIEGYGAIQTSGPGQFIRNDGTINFGVQGIGLSGQTAGALSTIINTGTIKVSADLDDPIIGSIAVNLNIDNVKVVNTGLIEAGAGIIAISADVSVTNTGTITTDYEAVLLYFENCRLTNTGTISSSGTLANAAVYFGYETNLVLNNSGTIESGTNGVAGGVTRAVNSGDIVAVGTGIADWSEKSFSLTNTGLIIGGYAGVTSLSGYDTGPSVIVNYGTISGQYGTATPGDSIKMEGGFGRIVNYGTLIGDVTMDCQRNILTNAGTIDGDVIIFGDLSSYLATATGVVLGDIFVIGGPARMQGGDSIDRLFGGESNDIINGGGGNDLINGGAARDILTGGTGADMFVFSTAEDIKSFYGSDRIADFQTGIDQIDLSAFMSGGAFIGGARFQGIAGEVRYNATTGQLVGDTDGDRVFDWSMAFTNKAALTVADFIF